MLRKKRLFTPGPTPILPAAQTAMASFAMHHRPADFRALFSRVLSEGKFGERWRDLAKAFGCEVEVISGPYGETFSLDEIRRKLTPEIRAVYVQATESSTGARHDVEGIAKVVRASGDDTLLVVDAITGLGTTHLNVDG